jgi:nicotinamidase-related amidase
MYRVEKQSSIA